MSAKGYLTLQEISSRTGLGLSGLNFYVNLGLLPVADRRGNKRLFKERIVLQRLKEIKNLKRQGYPLRIIVRQLTGVSAA